MKLLASACLALACTLASAEQQSRARASDMLRVPRRNHGVFEELKDDDFERECQEEMCDREEMREIYPDNPEMQEQQWDKLTNWCRQPEHMCNPEGTVRCIQKWQQRTCFCKDGFQGDSCSEDVDECESGDNDCADQGKACLNTIGSYKCGCESGYEMNVAAGKCEDIDECLAGPCGAHAKCANTDGGFMCTCDAGYEQAGDDQTQDCVDVNECDSLLPVCGVNKNCVNTDGGHECVCNLDAANWNTAANGDCEDIDECAAPDMNCNPGDCTNLPGSYTCICDKGYAFNEENKSCEDIDECDRMIDPCVLSTCHNTEGSYECCNELTHDWLGGACELKDPCKEVVCGEAQECVLGVCKCTEDGFEEFPGEDGVCDDIDECKIPLTCNPITEECVNYAGGYECREIPKSTTTTTPEPTTVEATTTVEVTTTVEPTTEPPTTVEDNEPATSDPGYCYDALD